MSDHHEMESEGPWPAGWVWAIIAALVAAVLTHWIGETPASGAALVGLMVFVVYSVLLAQFWEAPASGPDGDGHGAHDSHHAH